MTTTVPCLLHAWQHALSQFVLYTKKGFFTCHTLLRDCPASSALPQGPKLTLWAPLGPGPSFMAVPSREVGARYCAPVLTKEGSFLARGSRQVHGHVIQEAIV